MTKLDEGVRLSLTELKYATPRDVVTQLPNNPYRPKPIVALEYGVRIGDGVDSAKNDV